MKKNIYKDKKKMNTMKSFFKKLVFWFCSVAVIPLVLFYKIGRIFSESDAIFAGQGQFLSLIPGKIGSHIRMAYYYLTLEKCEKDGYIGFGTFFSHPEAELGKKIYIGAFCILGQVKVEDYVTIGSGVHILSGRHQHEYNSINSPIQDQGGIYKKIRISENCWIGSGSVIMANLGRQNIVGAGSVVVKDTNDYELVAGNPARFIRSIRTFSLDSNHPVNSEKFSILNKVNQGPVDGTL